MRKLTVLAMLAATLMVGPAFARSTHNLMPTPNATFSPGVGGAASGPSTTNNDDTCDISVAPAATLLLPYFEVDFKSSAATARTTLFTITNVSYIPQIAHVVVWTDWSFPALDFNIFLTGYDVQPINLYDIFARGIIGDYGEIQPNPALVNAAGGAPMVHIRAIPEGGPVGTLSAAGVIPTNLPFTFYDRYTVNAAGVDRRIDRRQPLPALFAARYISGGTGSF